MPKKVYDNMLVPYSWYSDFVSEPGRDEPNIELGKNRLWFLYLSLRSEEQVLSGDPAIDYAVQGLLNQIERMRADVNDRDVEIARMRQAGLTSDQIGVELGVSGGAVRKTVGWRDYFKILNNSL